MLVSRIQRKWLSNCKMNLLGRAWGDGRTWWPETRTACKGSQTSLEKSQTSAMAELFVFQFFVIRFSLHFFQLLVSVLFFSLNVSAIFVDFGRIVISSLCRSGRAVSICLTSVFVFIRHQTIDRKNSCPFVACLQRFSFRIALKLLFIIILLSVAFVLSPNWWEEVAGAHNTRMWTFHHLFISVFCFQWPFCYEVFRCLFASFNG